MKNQSLRDVLEFKSWRIYRSFEPNWFYTTVGLLSLMIFCLLAGTIDERLLNGVSVWNKPFKFTLSFAVYFVTLLIIARYLPVGYLRVGIGRLIAGSITLVIVLEMAYIIIKAAMGEASHFNFTTDLHRIMYMLMGVGAVWTVMAPLFYAWAIGLNNAKNDPMVLSIIIGLGLSFVLGGGFGGYLGGQTSHWVNAAATDATGIWLFNWATDGGDLRVAHFFGLHAMQAIPLFALLLPKQLSQNTAYALVALFSATYTAFSVHTFIQAVQGQPFIS